MNGGAAGAQSIYDFWLGMLPQVFAQMGAAVPPSAQSNGTGSALPFPADQVAKAATMTSDALQSIARSYAPVLQAAGAPGLLAQWATMMPGLIPAQPTAAPAAAPTSAAAMAIPWMTMPFTPAMFAAAAGNAMPASPATAFLPLQQMQKAWTDFGSQMVGNVSQTYTTALDRTFGALGDALGLGPARKLQAAGQQIMAATIAQNEARAAYGMLVQSALGAGLQRLLKRLADKAQANERVDSVLALMRMWAVATEEAVHEVLQSERGLEATAAVTRAGLNYRRQMQAFASIIADALDMATRRDLDDAYREIQALKRELRSLRAPAIPAASTSKPRARGAKRAGSK
ncbi:MAG TPA: poly(R)-hydroxyalkanoic acid synthase subunit PhaE [Casimicrobiaceae bacterium]|nr:poly(R)-hydroxyalkanoic acid synthase subunit PhaE [Casimicrobiaceae bacterium]